MKSIIIVLFVVFNCAGANAQVPQFDKLEMLFAQKHYNRVYRKANGLLDRPEFDFSLLPTYYKSISLFQLAQNTLWLKRHPESLGEAEQLFLDVKSSERGEKLFNAHMYEITWLKNDMISWASDLKRAGMHEEFERANRSIIKIFGDLQKVDIPGDVTHEVIKEDEKVAVNEAASGKREIIITAAKKHIGTPYKWAGNTPSGFDCSGFTSYIMKEQGVDLPRRSSDQYTQSIKVKQKDVQTGDLVFFNNGSGVSHVGFVISKKGEPIVMIHSSSSKGIIITNIGQSEYWMKRLHGFGTFIN
jgi:hypothetical protein